MDDYLQNFLNYLKEESKENLAAVIVYGSYVKGYFDSEKSDYDLIILFKDGVPELQDEIKTKFPKISLQIYGDINQLRKKIFNGSWGTYILLKFQPVILFKTIEFETYQAELRAYDFNIKGFSPELKNKFIKTLKANTELALTVDGFELNKFFNAALLKKLQILNFLKTHKIILNFHDLIKVFQNDLIADDYSWIVKTEGLILNRSNELSSNKDSYVNKLRQIDSSIAKELLTSSNI